MSSMMKRLGEAEARLGLAKAEIKAKDAALLATRSRLTELEAEAAAGGRGEIEVHLRAELARLQRRTHAMENFLADYVGAPLPCAAARRELNAASRA